MTENTAPEQESPDTDAADAMREAAEAEQAAMTEALEQARLNYLTERVVRLNVAVRERDERIAELERALEVSNPSTD